LYTVSINLYSFGLLESTYNYKVRVIPKATEEIVLVVGETYDTWFFYESGWTDTYTTHAVYPDGGLGVSKIFVPHEPPEDPEIIITDPANRTYYQFTAAKPGLYTVSINIYSFGLLENTCNYKVKVIPIITSDINLKVGETIDTQTFYESGWTGAHTTIEVTPGSGLDVTKMHKPSEEPDDPDIIVTDMPNLIYYRFTAKTPDAYTVIIKQFNLGSLESAYGYRVRVSPDIADVVLTLGESIDIKDDGFYNWIFSDFDWVCDVSPSSGLTATMKALPYTPPEGMKYDYPIPFCYELKAEQAGTYTVKIGKMGRQEYNYGIYTTYCIYNVEVVPPRYD